MVVMKADYVYFHLAFSSLQYIRCAGAPAGQSGAVPGVPPLATLEFGRRPEPSSSAQAVRQCRKQRAAPFHFQATSRQLSRNINTRGLNYFLVYLLDIRSARGARSRSSSMNVLLRLLAALLLASSGLCSAAVKDPYKVLGVDRSASAEARFIHVAFNIQTSQQPLTFSNDACTHAILYRDHVFIF